jgi:hypothetical protein
MNLIKFMAQVSINSLSLQYCKKILFFWLLDLIFFSEAQQQTQPDKLVAPPKSSSLGEDCQEFHQHSHWV